jgi:hypothetical protein
MLDGLPVSEQATQPATLASSGLSAGFELHRAARR